MTTETRCSFKSAAGPENALSHHFYVPSVDAMAGGGPT
jgi:hypothetical protein